MNNAMNILSLTLITFDDEALRFVTTTVEARATGRRRGPCPIVTVEVNQPWGSSPTTTVEVAVVPKTGRCWGGSIERRLGVGVIEGEGLFCLGLEAWGVIEGAERRLVAEQDAATAAWRKRHSFGGGAQKRVPAPDPGPEWRAFLGELVSKGGC